MKDAYILTGWHKIRNGERNSLRADSFEDWACESCWFCGSRVNMGFSVADDAWMRVVGNENAILCPGCFDRRAQELNVKYSFEKVFPVSWNESLEPPGVRLRKRHCRKVLLLMR